MKRAAKTAAFAAAIGLSALLGCGRTTGEPTGPGDPPATSGPAITGDRLAILGQEQTLFIADTTVTCHGPFLRQCLQSGPSASGPWTLIYEYVEGFDWSPGFVYELRVKATYLLNPPADASRRHYRLLSVVSRTAVTPSP